MSIGIIFTMALASVAAALVTLTRVIGWRRVLKHATLIDVCFTILAAVVMAGTLTGMLIAILGGLVMAGVLSVANRLNGAVRAGKAACAKPVVDVEEDWCPGGSAGRL